MNRLVHCMRGKQEVLSFRLQQNHLCSFIIFFPPIAKISFCWENVVGRLMESNILL